MKSQEIVIFVIHHVQHVLVLILAIVFLVRTISNFLHKIIHVFQYSAKKENTPLRIKPVVYSLVESAMKLVVNVLVPLALIVLAARKILTILPKVGFVVKVVLWRVGLVL